MSVWLEATASTPTGMYADYWAEQIRNLAVKRRFIGFAQQVATWAYNGKTADEIHHAVTEELDNPMWTAGGRRTGRFISWIEQVWTQAELKKTIEPIRYVVSV